MPNDKIHFLYESDFKVLLNENFRFLFLPKFLNKYSSKISQQLFMPDGWNFNTLFFFGMPYGGLNSVFLFFTNFISTFCKLSCWIACCPRKNNSQHQTIIVEDPLIKLQLYRVNQSLSWKRAQHEFEGMKYTWLLMYKFAVFTVSEQICHSNSNFINKLSERDGILLTWKRKAI